MDFVSRNSLKNILLSRRRKGFYFTLDPSPVFMNFKAPKNIEEYTKRRYWEERYRGENEVVYDWFQSVYSSFLDSIKERMKHPSMVLNIGCGDSRLPLDLSDHFMINVDFSATVLKKMNRLAPESNWMTGSICEKVFRSDTFDVIIDKATLDALFSDGSSPWDPSEEARKSVSMCIESMYSALKPGGIFISLSLGQPHFRRAFYEQKSWSDSSYLCLGLYHLYIYHK